MGIGYSKIRKTEYTSSARTALDNLEKLIRLSERTHLMSIKEIIRLTTTVNTYTGEDSSLKSIVEKQEETATTIEDLVLECQRKHTEHVRQHANIVAHFNDNDGDDIKFTISKGVGKVFINQVEYPVQIKSIISPIIEFEYSAPNKWTWTVNVQSRECEGKSPRKLFTKTLKSILASDSVINIPEM